MAATAQAFRFDLIDRLSAGKLLPIDVATIAWKATQAGAKGVEDLSVNPDSRGANHSRLVKSVLGLNNVESEVLYAYDIPMWDAHEGERSIRRMLVKLPHEAIARDFQRRQAEYIKARSDPDNIGVPAFLEHPVTQEFGKDQCWPIGYYTDKVKLGNESFYRGSVKRTIMRSSITCWVFKCSDLCRCGCKQWALHHGCFANGDELLSQCSAKGHVHRC